MKLITPKRSTKWLDKGVLYELVSEEDHFGYYKVQEQGSMWIRYIHKSNMVLTNDDTVLE